MFQDNFISEEDPLTQALVEDYKKKGKIKKPFFPLPTYDMIQAGYPTPDHGVMVRRYYGGTDENGDMMSPKGMWCKVEDVKKWMEISSDCPLCKGDGRDPVQDGGLIKWCRHCGGTGKRPTIT